MQKRFLYFPFIIMFATGCNPSSDVNDNPEVKKLVDKSLANMVDIEGGSFNMGDFGSEINAKLPLTSDINDQPLHKVTLSNFSLSKYKITYQDYDIYTAATGKKKLDPGYTLTISKHFRDPDVAAALDWKQAREYCLWLGKQSDKKIDLPTEAQWEYAARNRGKYIVYATDNGQYEEGHNIPDAEQRDALMGYDLFNVPVGKFPPTPLGLYDMAGNGTDWILDWYSESYYSTSPENNPQGPDSGKEKVLRGFQQGGGKLSNQTVFRQHSIPNVNEGKDYSSPTHNARCVINQ